MKKFLNRYNFVLLCEQGLFSLFNFFIVIFLFRGITTTQIASMGVNLTALYGLLSISRNLISGDFIQDEFSTGETKLEVVLARVCRRSLIVAPITSIGVLFACFLTNTNLGLSILLSIISFEVTLVDNFRQVQILYQKMFFMITNLALSIMGAMLVLIPLDFIDIQPLEFWSVTFLIYIFINLTRLSGILLQITKTNYQWKSSISRKSITLESFFNHSLFFLFNYTFFIFDQLLSGQVRLITAWIVNSSSSLYITLGNFYSIKMVNNDSSKSEQRGINFLAFSALMLSAILFSTFSSYLPFDNLNFNRWLIFGTCLSNLAFFIHSRTAILYLHSNSANSFLRIRLSTWSITLLFQLLPTIFFSDLGFIVGSIASMFFVLVCYEKALYRTNLGS